MFEPDEKAVEVVLPRFLDFAAVDVDVVDNDLLLISETRDVETKRRDVVRKVLSVLFETHQDAGLVVANRAMYEKGRAEKRLA